MSEPEVGWLDGNAAAGIFAEAFCIEMTTAIGDLRRLRRGRSDG